MSTKKVNDTNINADEFVQIEYVEAINAYHKGVNIGYTMLKGYLTANGLLLGVLSAILTVSSENKLTGTLEILALFFNFIIPAFALILSAIMFFSIPHYAKHLDNCQDRAAALENKFNGQLFNNLKSISDKGSFNTLIALRGIVLLFGLFWICFPIVRIM